MRSAIVAPQPIAVEEGAQVLLGGGNAIDAAVTAAFVQTVVDPQMCGIGGYGLLTLHPAGAPAAGASAAIGLDAPALAGSSVAPDMWADRIIGLNPDGWGYFLEGKVNDAGYESICTPGTVRLLAAMLERWGTITWQDAIAPALRIAERGFAVHETLARQWRTPAAYPQACSQLEYIQRNSEAARIYLKPDGAPYATGEVIRNPDYAATLRELALRGPDDFYTGALAQTMLRDLAAHGARITADDLRDYTMRETPPVTGTYRNLSVATSDAPHGGPTLIAILNILEGFDLAGMGHNSPEYIYTVAMAMKAAFADRNRYVADPAFVDVPTAWMTSRGRADEWRAHIRGGRPIEPQPIPTGTPTTTHVTAADRHGNVVALTHSLGASSGVITPGLGFMYNNSMINFDPQPGGANSIAPRKGRTTGMAPTLLYRDGRPVAVLGAPGATRIITGVLQVILNLVDFGMSASDAVLAPRFDCQINLIRCQRRIPRYVLEAVAARHPIDYIPQSHGGMSLVHALTIDPASGAMAGGADSGGDGMAVVI